MLIKLRSKRAITAKMLRPPRPQHLSHRLQTSLTVKKPPPPPPTIGFLYIQNG